MIKPNQHRPRKTPQQDRAQATLDAILEASAQILARDSDIKTSDVAKRAGISIGSFYQYFRGKDALVSSLIQRFVGRKFEEAGKQLSSLQDLPLEIAIERFVDEVIALELRTLGLGVHLMHLMFRLGSFDLVGEVDDRFLGVIQGFLEAIKDRTRPLNPEKAAFVLLYSFRSTLAAAAYKRRDWLRDSEFRQEMIQLVLAYLKK